MENQTRHPALPQGLDAVQLADWIRNNYVENGTDEVKKFFTEEEKNDFEHESALSGREIKRLTDMKKIISQLMLKGNDEERTFVIPATLGTKVLDRNRNQNYDLIEKGYEMDTVSFYVLPYADNETMESFTLEGKHLADRSREMTVREKNLYVGIFTGVRDKIGTHKGEAVNETSGEILGPDSNFRPITIYPEPEQRTGTND